MSKGSERVKAWRLANPEKRKKQWLREWVYLKEDPKRHAEWLEKKKEWDAKYRKTHTIIQKPRPWSSMTEEQRKRKLFTDKQWRLRNKEQVKLIHKKAKDNAQFGGNREKVILRDKETCQMCGITRAEHYNKYNKDITVDHKDRLGRGVKLAEKNNNMENLWTLCISCHMKKDGKPNLKHGVI